MLVVDENPRSGPGPDPTVLLVGADVDKTVRPNRDRFRLSGNPTRANTCTSFRLRGSAAAFNATAIVTASATHNGNSR